MTGISPLATRPEPAIWRGMDRAALDIAYDNTAAVAESAAFLADWSLRSAALRAAHPALIDLDYGPRERNRIDIFRSGRENAPLFVFIHGGYWQRNSREVFSCMAEGLLPHGIDVALPGYTLAPDATLGEIVQEVHAAIRWLRLEGPSIGVARDRLIASGWSAGGHLAATAMALMEVDAAMPISGIFDLEPIRLGCLNDKLGLEPGDVTAFSPVLHLPDRQAPAIIVHGEAELPELQRQSQDYAAAWMQRGYDCRLVPVEAANHFSILEHLRQPDGRIARLAATLAR